ncbi:DUF1697 domain-containing protein [Methanobacterium sp. VT]|uniref:DUF1697 domain-containing protein n=2 Tax=Methanobacterium spitsbergense TaxID=2874285 RepID=A0A8T5UXG8_9EURY|nr:DUF1697 domain-containing protein [Methanobacterium spitsbergense]
MLRGINVGRTKRVKMDELKEVYKSLNFKDVKTYIQSGNVIFQFKNIDTNELKIKIKNKLKETLGFDVAVVIRTKEELEKIINENPLKKEDINHTYITFLSNIPSEDLFNDIKIKIDSKMKNKNDKIINYPKEIYLFLPDGYGRTKLNNNFFEKQLKVTSTTRNLKTVKKLLNIAESLK